MRFLNHLLFAWTLFYSLHAGARPTPKAPDQIPREVARVVSISSRLFENRLRSDLKGTSNGSIWIDVELETRMGFRLYADKIDFFSADDEWDFQIETKPKSIRFIDPISKTLKEGYQDQNLFRIVATPKHPLTQDTAKVIIPLAIAFQACSTEVCLLPVAILTPINLATSPVAAAMPWLDRAGHWIQVRLKEGNFGVLLWLLMFVGGLGTALTPCVYPLYPITVGIFSRQSKSHPTAQALAYAGGLSLSYASLGLVASLVGGVFGSLTQTPGFLIGVGAVLAFSALSFAGWLPFPMSNRLLNFVTQMGQTRHPLIQAFLMGAGLGIVASPCVGPILVAVLSGLSAAQVSPLTGFLLLTVFGLGMSTPFLALALIAHHLGTSPRLSGQSLSWIKNIGAIALLGASLFFLVPGIKLLRVTKSTEAHFTFPVQNLSEWKGQKWTVIDFRADWCAACLDLDTKTFSSKNVSAYFTPNSEGFSSWDFVRVDFTESNSNTEALAKQWGVVGLPTVIFTNPNGTICKEQSLFRFEGPQEFSERLERVKAQCQR